MIIHTTVNGLLATKGAPLIYTVNVVLRDDKTRPWL